ncbi:MAG: trigger factor, partial [Alphaproteobacteria bacterium]|nr:trigger factor [Alphaproteobacteria bacterium]
IKIPGFRPGNVPMKILKQRYGQSVTGDVLHKAINDAASETLRARNLRPALTPKVEEQDYKEGGDFSFTLSVEVFPEVPEVKFDGITIERPVYEIDEKEITDAATRIAERNPKLSAKEGKAAKGDVVKIDFKGMIDGKAFAGGTSSDFNLELGSGQFIDGFEDQLIGTKAGDDKIVSVIFPKDYPGAEVAGKEASFAVTVKEVQSKETPAVDDEFAKSIGFADLAALQEAIRSQMAKEYDNVVRGKMKKQLFDVLEKECKFDLPQGMLDLEFKTIWEQVQQQGEKIEDEAKAREEYMGIARRRVKLGILLAEIGTRQKLQITREEIMRAVMQQAQQFPGQEQQVMEFYKNNPNRVDDLRGPILEEKAVDFILGSVKMTDKKVTLEELAESEDEEEGAAPKKKAKAKSEDAGEEKAKTKKKASGE